MHCAICGVCLYKVAPALLKHKETGISTPIIERTIHVVGNRLVCLIAGDPTHTPLVLVHGWGHHPDIWRSTMIVLSDHYYCVAVGVLGFGDSDKPASGDYTIAPQGRDVLAIADALGIDRFILCGQSRGGQIALCIAAQLAPQRIIKLTDISGVASGHIGWYLRYVLGAGIWLGAWFPASYRLLRWVYRNDQIARAFYGPYFANWRQQPAGVAQRDLLRALNDDAHRSNWLTMHSMYTTDLLPSLHQIQAPTLVLFGKQDRIVPPSEGSAAAHRIANVRLVLLDDCGHYPMLDQPAAYLAALTTFLAES